MFDFDRWHEAVDALMFPSQQVAVQQEHANAIVSMFENQTMPQKAHFAPGTPLLDLAQHLDDCIQALGGGAFARLSTRSPKDAVPVCSDFLLKPMLEVQPQISNRLFI